MLLNDDPDADYYGTSTLQTDPHVMANGVLVNSLGITNTHDLIAAENDFSELRLIQLVQKPILGEFDLLHARKVHAFIFQDIYPWAGEVRSVDIAKGSCFFLSQSLIAPYFDQITLGIHDSGLIGGARVTPRRQFCDKAGQFIGMFNNAHPFREGNGRTQRELLRLLALKHGYAIDWSGTSPGSMRQACIAAKEDKHCIALGKLIWLASCDEQPASSSDLSLD